MIIWSYNFGLILVINDVKRFLNNSWLGTGWHFVDALHQSYVMCSWYHSPTSSSAPTVLCAGDEAGLPASPPHTPAPSQDPWSSPPQTWCWTRPVQHHSCQDLADASERRESSPGLDNFIFRAYCQSTLLWLNNCDPWKFEHCHLYFKKLQAMIKRLWNVKQKHVKHNFF